MENSFSLSLGSANLTEIGVILYKSLQEKSRKIQKALQNCLNVLKTVIAVGRKKITT